MLFLLLSVSIVAVLALFIIARNTYRLKTDFARFRKEISQKSGLVFLINKDFEVKDTNYYQMNANMAGDGQPPVLGNVLHCKSGCDSGLCGTGFACQTCPVRLVIKNSFKNRRDFDSIEATMELYDASHEVQKVDVTVAGELVYAYNKPYMMVSVTSFPIGFQAQV